MREIEAKAIERLDFDGLLDQLCTLLAIESTSGSETPAQEFMADRMSSIGMDVDRWSIDMDRLRQHPSYTAEVDRTEAIGVVGQYGAANGPTLVLNGHVDVVPPGEISRWTYPPFAGTLADDRVYGRGAADMKGALCCALAAIEAIREADIRLHGRVLLQSVVGEEDGGMGTLAAVERGYTGDAGIVLEPTQLMVAPAQAGAMNFRITVPGLAAHGALRCEGVDPIERFIPIFHAIRAFERMRNASIDHPHFSEDQLPFAICIGTVTCGVWASTVAESLICEGRLGFAPGEDAGQVRAEFTQVVEQAAEDLSQRGVEKPAVEWWGAQFMPAAIDAGQPIISTVCDAHAEVTGSLPPVRGMPYGADMRLLVNEGDTPTVLYGPGDVRVAHAPDEYVPIDDLRIATQVLIKVILRTCGAA